MRLISLTPTKWEITVVLTSSHILQMAGELVETKNRFQGPSCNNIRQARHPPGLQRHQICPVNAGKCSVPNPHLISYHILECSEWDWPILPIDLP